MIRRLGLFLLGCALASAATIADWSGSWTDVNAYGGEFKVCVDEELGTAQGFYSDIGYVYGQVLMVEGVPTWSGAWHEAGEYGFGDNWGYVYLQLAEDGNSFNGTWTLANAPSLANVWSETNNNHVAPSKEECWAADFSNSAVSSERTAVANSMNLHGLWKETDGNTPKWWICVSGNTFTSSYEYYSDGKLTKGYITGDVVLHGRLLMGNWFEEGGQGIYLIAASSDEGMRATWWAVTDLAHVDYSQHTDPDYQGFDISVRLDLDADEDECNQYACIVGGCKDEEDDDDDEDDNEGVVVAALAACVAVSGLAMLGMFSFLHKAGACGSKHKHHHADPKDVQLKDSA